MHPQSPPTDFTLIYDGACGLCRRIVRWIHASRPRHPIRFIDYHNTRVLAHLPVDRDEAENSVILLTPDGLKARGYEAVTALMSLLPRYRSAAPVLGLPGIKHLGRAAYRLTSNHRHTISKLAGLNTTPTAPQPRSGGSV